MAHALAGRGSYAGDEADDRFFHVDFAPFGGFGFVGAADLADHDDRLGVRVVVEGAHDVDVFQAVDRVPANAHSAGLAQSDFGQLHCLVGQRAGAADDADAASPVDVARHDADLDFFGRDQTGATVSVIYVPPAGAAAAIWEAVDADLDLAICITEGIPVRDMLEVRNKMRAKEAAGGTRTLLLGPNCPGLITPDEIKIGIMPGHIHRKGRIGVVSRSGTLTYEAVAQLTDIGLGQSSAVGIGGDPINGLKHIDVMKAFNDDPDTDAVIMIGEIGGPDEADAARWCKAHMKKPIVGFIAGVTAPAGKRMGHAGALISGGADTADAKLAVMEECGFKVTRNPSEMAKLLKALI